jgi:NHL repeat
LYHSQKIPKNSVPAPAEAFHADTVPCGELHTPANESVEEACMKRFHRSGLGVIVVLLLGVDGIAQISTSRQTIATYVGPSLPVSGAQALTQVFDSASDPISDGAGGFYFVSLAQNRVYRVKSEGTLVVIAGTGAVGFSGDGGLAIAAELSLPTGIALDAQGNLFIADLSNHRVRRVNPAGVISTVAGTGEVGSD